MRFAVQESAGDIQSSLGMGLPYSERVPLVFQFSGIAMLVSSSSIMLCRCCSKTGQRPKDALQYSYHLRLSIPMVVTEDVPVQLTDADTQVEVLQHRSDDTAVFRIASLV